MTAVGRTERESTGPGLLSRHDVSDLSTQHMHQSRACLQDAVGRHETRGCAEAPPKTASGFGRAGIVKKKKNMPMLALVISSPGNRQRTSHCGVDSLGSELTVFQLAPIRNALKPLVCMFQQSLVQPM